MRIPVEYTYPEEFGDAEAVYCFEPHEVFILAAGTACIAERLHPGMRFHVKGGGLATVTRVGKPIPWPEQNPVPDKHGLVRRRVLGKIKHVGHVVVDVVAAGQKVTTTPDHSFRLSTGEWVQAAKLRPAIS